MPPTEEGQEVLQEVLRNVQSVVFPDVDSQTGVLVVFVVTRDPQLGGPIQLGQVEWL